MGDSTLEPGVRAWEPGEGCAPTNMDPPDKVLMGLVRQSVPVPSLQGFYSGEGPEGGCHWSEGMVPLTSTSRTLWDWIQSHISNPSG